MCFGRGSDLSREYLLGVVQRVSSFALLGILVFSVIFKVYVLYLNFAILSLCELLQYRYFYVYLCGVDLNGLKYEQQDLPYRYTEF